ncbi:MAG: hypothetical protein P9L97_06220 [Candidatus Tenebribacter davisii]|nr:hypothetical protein [Candidatus Tenebribacter davisii]
MGTIESDKEARKIGKDLKPAEVKTKISKIKWKKDHRGIKYDKKSGVVTAT